MICGCRRATGAGVVAAVRNRAPPSRSIVADAHARTRALWPGVHIFHLFGHPAAARRAESGGAGSSNRARRSVPSARRIPAGARIERDERQGEVLGPGAAAARGTRRPVAARPCRRPQRRGREALRVDRARAHPGAGGRTQVLMAAGRSSAAGPAPVTNRSRPTARAAKLPSAAAPTSLGSVAGMSPPIRAGMRPWSASTSASASGALSSTHHNAHTRHGRDQGRGRTWVPRRGRDQLVVLTTDHVSVSANRDGGICDARSSRSPEAREDVLPRPARPPRDRRLLGLEPLGGAPETGDRPEAISRSASLAARCTAWTAWRSSGNPDASAVSVARPGAAKTGAAATPNAPRPGARCPPARRGIGADDVPHQP